MVDKFSLDFYSVLDVLLFSDLNSSGQKQKREKSFTEANFMYYICIW